MLGFSLVAEALSSGRVITWLQWKGRLWMTIGMYARATGAARQTIWFRIKQSELPFVGLTPMESTATWHLTKWKTKERVLIERSTVIALLEHSKSLRGKELFNHFQMLAHRKDTL